MCFIVNLDRTIEIDGLDGGISYHYHQVIQKYLVISKYFLKENNSIGKEERKKKNKIR